MTSTIRRLGLLLWAAVSFLAASVLVGDYVDPDAGGLLFWAAPCLTLFLAALYIRDPLRRRFYAGILGAAVLGLGLVYVNIVLAEKRVDDDARSLYQTCLEDYLTRELPGWEYQSLPWEPEVVVEAAEGEGQYRVLLAAAYVANESDSLLVFGNMHQAGPFQGWQDPRLYVCPLDSTGRIADGKQFAVIWPGHAAMPSD